MKFVNFLLAVMFLAFAFLQINDPDPVHWIAIYGLMAVTCVLAAFQVYYRIPMIFFMIVLIGYSIVFLDGLMEWFAQPDKSVLFDEGMKMQYLYIEESREFLGLWICVIVLIIHLILSRRTAKS
jgi:hypothetical protein